MRSLGACRFSTGQNQKTFWVGLASSLVPVVAILSFLTGCATSDIRSSQDNGAGMRIGRVSDLRVANEPSVPSDSTIRVYSAPDCPAISDDANVLAQVSTADSGAPRTQHPGLDLYVREGPEQYVVRVHFGDLGDGRNSCLPFDECKNMHELPTTYSVSTPRLKRLLAYLKERHYCVGKFSSWGVPVFPWPAEGSNCGDAFVRVLDRLDLTPRVLPEMRQWIKSHRAGVWAFDRGWRRPTDEFFNEPPTVVPTIESPG